MTALRYLTAGESHGRALVGILEGMPARVPLLAEDIDRDLARRQLGHGRSSRMRIEKDSAQILSGVRQGLTMGSPVALLIENRIAAEWADDMAVEPGREVTRPLVVPRPGHADLAGSLKYGWTDDLRPVLERASARETAMRVGIGAVARRLLAELGIEIASWVVAVGDVSAPEVDAPSDPSALRELRERADASPMRCLHDATTRAMIESIDVVRRERDSLGGIVEVVACGVPAGLGSHVHWDRKLDGRLAGALMSVQAVKGVEIGGGFRTARKRGSQVHDSIGHDGARYTRGSNFAGGIEGGMSNGQPIRLRLAKKPISTLTKPLPSVDVRTRQPADAHVERADTCAVPALGVICEAVAALALAEAVLECFGGDALEEVRERVAARRRAG